MSDEAIVKATPKKTWVQEFVERARGEIQAAPPASAVSYVREGGNVLGDYSFGGVIGALLGAAHAKWGLDTKHGPADGWIAGLGALASVGLSGHLPEVSAWARKIGTAGATIVTFRKSYEVVKHEPLSSGGAAPGIQRIAAPGNFATGEDPIEAVARSLGG